MNHFPCELPVLKVADLGSSKAWRGCEQGVGMSCLDGAVFLGHPLLGAWVLSDPKALIAGKPGALLRLNLAHACRKEVTFHFRGRWKKYLFGMLVSSK